MRVPFYTQPPPQLVLMPSLLSFLSDSCASSILSPISDNTSCSSASGSASAPDLASLDRSRLPHSVQQSLSFSFSLSKSRDRQSSHQSPRMITRPIPAQCRRNEHLAVLIPRTLWKVSLWFQMFRKEAEHCSIVQPDSLANKCDKYACKVKFSVWERKHVSHV